MALILLIKKGFLAIMVCKVKCKAKLKELGEFMVNKDIEKQISEALKKVFKDPHIEFDKSHFAGGLTNYNYIMHVQGKSYVVRKPGALTDQIIDRGIEKKNNAKACDLGVNSNCLYFDEHTGIKISYFIEDSVNFAMANPYAEEQMGSVVQHLKKLHNSPSLFDNMFDFEKELIHYEKIVEDLKGDLFFDYSGIKSRLLSYQAQNIAPMLRVSCHNDTVPENFLKDNKGRTYLIDWEYSGLNDPTWDIAAYILESRLPEEEVSIFLERYYQEGISAENLLKIKFFILAQDLLWTVWALIRHYGGDDFLDYCYMRYERLRENMVKLDGLEQVPIHELY